MNVGSSLSTLHYFTTYQPCFVIENEWNGGGERRETRSVLQVVYIL